VLQRNRNEMVEIWILILFVGRSEGTYIFIPKIGKCASFQAVN
jgi:hypothetical protein